MKSSLISEKNNTNIQCRVLVVFIFLTKAKGQWIKPLLDRKRFFSSAIKVNIFKEKSSMTSITDFLCNW